MVSALGSVGGETTGGLGGFVVVAVDAELITLTAGCTELDDEVDDAAAAPDSGCCVPLAGADSDRADACKVYSHLQYSQHRKTLEISSCCETTCKRSLSWIFLTSANAVRPYRTVFQLFEFKTQLLLTRITHVVYLVDIGSSANELLGYV
jgi:hypothetical protein